MTPATEGTRSMGTRRPMVAILAWLCALVVVFAVSGAWAGAAVTHEYLKKITEVPVGSGAQFTGPLDKVESMTVDAGELYIAEGENEVSRLNKFDAASGAFLAQFPHVPSLGYLDQGVAVADATGDVYVGGDEGQAGRVAVFSAGGNLLSTWNGADTLAGNFGCFGCGSPAGVAVDNSGSLADWAAGDVYVSVPEQGAVYVFKPKAGGGEEYVTQLPDPEPGVPFNFAGAGGVTVDQANGDVLIAERQAVDVFEPTVLHEYALTRRLTAAAGGPFTLVKAVAVDDASGDTYVADQTNTSNNEETAVLDQFSSAGVYLGHLTGTPSGLFRQLNSVAVDQTSHYVYAGDELGGSAGLVDVFGPGVVIPDVATEPASNVRARSAALAGTVNPRGAGAATCRFQWGTSTAFGNAAPCEPEGVADGSSPVGVHAALGGLQPDTTYYYRLAAGNANGINPGEGFQTEEFTTPGPGIPGQPSATAVTSSSATLAARVDPHGAPTSYYFQYGTSSSYGSSAPAAPGQGLGSGEGALAASVHLQGLAAYTTYHYRLIVIGEPGELVTVETPDQTFTTQGAGTETTQPDGRAWELVSPPNKLGAGIIAIGNEQGDDIQAAADGGGITYGASSPFAANPAGSNSPEVTQVISTRHAPGRWDSADITTPHTEGASEVKVGHAAEYKLFSSDLSLGLVEPAGKTPLPPQPPGAEKTVYLRAASGEYNALVTPANVPPHTEYGGDGHTNRGVEFLSASPDLSHVVLTSEMPLTSPAPPAASLYEWAGGQLQLANVLPDGEPVASARLGDVGQIERNVRHAISRDGSRLVFTAYEAERRFHVYLRDMTRVGSGAAVQVDAAQGAPEPSDSESYYQTANDEGSMVFFTSSARLTADATAPSQFSQTAALYVFELTSGRGEALAGKLTDLTVDPRAGERPDVQGVIGASEDGSYIYFAANGLLGDAAEHGATPGGNLYVEHYDQQTRAWTPPSFIAHAASWGNGLPDLARTTSRVSPNGRYLAFMSASSTTGYDNRDANSGVPDEEVFLYDATSRRVVCASCNPTGARPVGMQGSQNYEERLWDYGEIWRGRWVAGDIPGWTSTDLVQALTQSRYLSDSGRLFFNSSDSLVPGDVNGTEDVYQYEPAGLGSCQGPGYGQSATVIFSEKLGGCIGLISSGTSSEESAFMDASETGADVFFLTLSRLSPVDLDTSIDIYDAHECTASSPCAPQAALVPPPCATGDACKPGPTPQPALFGQPPSETFSGAGNAAPAAAGGQVKPRSLTRSQKLSRALKACRKKPKRKRAGCERLARKKYGTKRSRAGKSLSSRARR